MRFMNNYKVKIMKRTVILLLLISMIPVHTTSAQNTNLEKLNNYKIGFFTKRLNFTSEEAQKFWPVYNEYQNQRNQIQLEKIKLIRNFNQNENSLSNDQLAEIGDKLVNSIVQESSLAVAFHKKLKEVLPPAKVIRYYQAENQYKMQLLNELQNVRQQQKLRPGRGL
jgi:curli biogenesis system outer membrane secretion channel CsgG